MLKITGKAGFDHANRPLVECLCTCGNTFTVTLASLKDIKKCEKCKKHRKPRKKQNLITDRTDLTGKKFGKLTVIKVLKKIGNFRHWLCECECGSTKVVQHYLLTRKQTRSCGCLKSNRGPRGAKPYKTWGTASQYVGVTKAGKRWVARIQHKNICTRIGTFDSPEAAVNARNQYILIHGIQKNYPIQNCDRNTFVSEGLQ